VLEAADWAIDREDLAEVIDPQDLVEAIDREDLAEVIDPQDLVEAIDPEDLAEARQAVETGVHLGVDPEVSTDRAHAPAAAGVPPAWDLEAEAAAVAEAVEGGGRHG
jgi:hypothetical protein